MWNEAIQFHPQDFELFTSRAAHDQPSLSNMSSGFSVSDFFAISRLLIRLSEDYASAPAEGQELASDLKVLQDCMETLRKSSENFSPEDNARLAERIAPLSELLKEMEKLSEKYSSLTESEPRAWDRVKFPKLKVQAIHKRINLHMTTLNLFMGIRSTTSLGNIEDVLEKFARNNPGGAFLRSDENWNRSLLPELQQRGVALDSAQRCRTFIEEHLVALSEVEVANSQLLDNFEGTIMPEDAIDEHIVVGGPTAEHTFSCICPGALKLQNGDLSGIKESQSLFYRHFGGHKYELSCKHCKFHGFQDEPLKTKDGKINTPLLFCSREKPLSKNSTEYYLDVHKKKQGVPDGLFYHTMFFWKSHVQAKKPSKHDAAYYECVFCPKEAAYGALMDRKQYIHHIRLQHVQQPPPPELREKFNVFIESHPALFKTDEGLCHGKKFDILLPRALGRTDILRAEQAKREAEVLRVEEEKRKEEEKKKAEEKLAAEARKKAEDAENAKVLRITNGERSLDAQNQVQQAFSTLGRAKQRQLEQGRQPKLLGGVPASPMPLAWSGSQGEVLSTPKSILKNKGEAGKAVHFQFEEKENAGVEENWEEYLARLDEEQRQLEEREPVLNLVKTTYTPVISQNGERSAVPKPRSKIVEVSSGDAIEMLSPRPTEQRNSPESRRRILRREEVGMGDLDSAVDISGA